MSNSESPGVDAVEPRAWERPWTGWALVGVIALVLVVSLRAMVFGGLEPIAVDTAAANAHHAWIEERAGGEVPQWYPDILFGLPSYPSFVYTPASPWSWIHNTFDLNRGTRYVLWMIVGAAASLALFRRWGASWPAAFAATITVVFTPYIFGLINAGHSSKLMALAFVPLVWLAVEALLSKPGLLTVGLAAWAISFQLWANHPQIAFYTWLLLGPYAAIRWWTERRTWLSPVALGVAFLLAFLMVSLPYLPVQSYTHESTRGAASVLGEGVASGTQSWEYATNWSFHPRELISFVYPSFFGLQSDTYWGWMPLTQSTHAIGTVPLVLAILGLLVTSGWRRWFLLAGAVVVLVVGFGRHVPVLFAPLYHGVPFFDKFRVPSMIYAMLPILAGFAMVRAVDGTAARTLVEAGRSRWIVGLGIVFAVGAAFGLAGIAGLGSGLADSGWFHRMFDATRDRPSFDLVAERRAMLFGDVTRASLLALLTLAVVWFSSRLPRAATLAALIALVGIDLFTVNRPFYHPKPRAEADAVSRVDDALATVLTGAGVERVLPIELVPQRTEDGRTTLVVSGLLQSNDYGRHRIESVGGYHPAGLIRAKDFTLSGAWRNPSLWPALGIDAVVFHARVAGVPETFWRDLGAQYDGLELLSNVSTRSGDVAVFRYAEGLGRAFVVPSVSVTSSPREGLVRISSEVFDPSEVALVERPVDVTSSGAGRVVSIDRDDERVSVRVDGGGGLLVLTDAFADRWRATIDGTDAAVVPVNHVLRGVSVPAGSHDVVFEYRDEVFERANAMHGAGRGLATLAIVAGALLTFVRQRRSPARPTP